MQAALIRTAVILTAFFTAGIAFAASDMPRADGDAVVEYTRQTNPYWNWQTWPGKGKLYKGQPPHGAFLSTYVNDAAFQAIENKAGVLPDGAIVLKENYTPKKSLAAVTVMVKQKGYNPDAGDWFWVKYAPDGTVQAEGKVDSCIKCHNAEKENDWLFTGKVGN